MSVKLTGPKDLNADEAAEKLVRKKCDDLLSKIEKKLNSVEPNQPEYKVSFYSEPYPEVILNMVKSAYRAVGWMIVEAYNFTGRDEMNEFHLKLSMNVHKL